MERRELVRQRVLKAGKIAFGRAGIIDCSVRNLSDRGALLQVESPLGIPDAFRLVIAPDPSARRCRVVWRKEKQIGVEFLGDG